MEYEDPYREGRSAFYLCEPFNPEECEDWKAGWRDAEAEMLLDEELRKRYYG